MNTTPTALRLEHITKRFPGVLANDDVTVEVGAGEILGILGENGAGKTTLMNILSGLYRPDDGRIVVGGQPVLINSPRDAIARGNRYCARPVHALWPGAGSWRARGRSLRRPATARGDCQGALPLGAYPDP